MSRLAVAIACCAVGATLVAQQKPEQLSETYRGSRRNDVEYQ